MMTITIRNPRVEALIREIGDRTGEDASAIVARAVENLSAREADQGPLDISGRDGTPPGAHSGPAVPEEEVRRRLAVFEDLARRYPPSDQKLTWEEVEREMDSLFDYLDEEPAKAGSQRKPR
jgi:hypothetical protein